MFEVITVEFYENIKKLMNESRKHVVSYVNTSMLFTYWNIGKMIVEEQGGDSKAKYGEKLILELSKQMTLDFGKGFDARNLRYMRKFYLLFPIWNTLCSKLSWSHYRLLIKIENIQIRNFYMEEAIKGNWSVRQLERQIATCSYSRTIKYNGEVQKIKNVDEKVANPKYDPNTVIKDPYMLEFLGLDNNVVYLKKELEEALINHLQNFLLELGRGFCFVARNKRISFNSYHYFIDLVFYNSILKCYVLIVLKTNKLSHEALGQIDLYRNYYDQEIKMVDDNPTIGLLLVTEQDSIVTKYSSIYKDQNIFVSKYMTYLPTEEELKKVINEEKRLIENFKNLNK